MASTRATAVITGVLGLSLMLAACGSSGSQLTVPDLPDYQAPSQPGFGTDPSPDGAAATDDTAAEPDEATYRDLQKKVAAGEELTIGELETYTDTFEKDADRQNRYSSTPSNAKMDAATWDSVTGNANSLPANWPSSVGSFTAQETRDAGALLFQFGMRNKMQDVTSWKKKGTSVSEYMNGFTWFLTPTGKANVTGNLTTALDVAASDKSSNSELAVYAFVPVSICELGYVEGGDNCLGISNYLMRADNITPIRQDGVDGLRVTVRDRYDIATSGEYGIGSTHTFTMWRNPDKKQVNTWAIDGYTSTDVGWKLTGKKFVQAEPKNEAKTQTVLVPGAMSVNLAAFASLRSALVSPATGTGDGTGPLPPGTGETGTGDDPGSCPDCGGGEETTVRIGDPCDTKDSGFRGNRAPNTVAIPNTSWRYPTGYAGERITTTWTWVYGGGQQPACAGGPTYTSTSYYFVKPGIASGPCLTRAQFDFRGPYSPSGSDANDATGMARIEGSDHIDRSLPATTPFGQALNPLECMNAQRVDFKDPNIVNNGMLTQFGRYAFKFQSWAYQVTLVTWPNQGEPGVQNIVTSMFPEGGAWNGNTTGKLTSDEYKRKNFYYGIKVNCKTLQDIDVRDLTYADTRTVGSWRALGDGTYRWNDNLAQYDTSYCPPTTNVSSRKREATCTYASNPANGQTLNPLYRVPNTINGNSSNAGERTYIAPTSSDVQVRANNTETVVQWQPNTMTSLGMTIRDLDKGTTITPLAHYWTSRFDLSTNPDERSPSLATTSPNSEVRQYASNDNSQKQPFYVSWLDSATRLQLGKTYGANANSWALPRTSREFNDQWRIPGFDVQFGHDTTQGRDWQVSPTYAHYFVATVPVRTIKDWVYSEDTDGNGSFPSPVLTESYEEVSGKLTCGSNPTHLVARDVDVSSG